MNDVDRRLRATRDDLPTSLTSLANIESGTRHSKVSRAAAGVVGLSLTALLTIGLFAIMPRERTTPSEAGGGGQAGAGNGTLGIPLARELGLEPLEGSVVEGCEYFVKVDNGPAYCLDPVVADEDEAFVLSHMILGQEPTAAELELFELGASLEDLPNSDEIDAHQRAVLERIVELMKQVDRESAA